MLDGEPRSPVDPGERHAPVAGIQRARILSAAFDVAYEHGAANVTVAHISERSGVSRRTFYEMFSDCEQCLLAALDEATERARARVLPAYRGEARWDGQVRAGLTALLRLFDEEPAIGRFLIAESLAAGPRVLERRTRVLAGVIAAVDEGRGLGGSVALPSVTAEGVVGGVLAVLHARLTERRHGPLVALAGELMSMIVLPYLGVKAARKELERPVIAPAVQGREHVLAADPFKEAGLRLTYRTVRVLMAIADRPDASNRVVGDGAQIRDPGQISKLLARLDRGGLIVNAGLGPGHGAPNAWSLTDSGRQVVNRIRAHGGERG